MRLDEFATEVEQLSLTEKIKALGVSNFIPAHFEVVNAVIRWRPTDLTLTVSDQYHRYGSLRQLQAC